MNRKALVLALIGSAMLFGCGEKESTPGASTVAPVSTAENPVSPQPEQDEATVATAEHFYSMKDGTEYGYEHAISEDAQQQGQAAAKLTMFKYAGEKDGHYQVYSKENGAVQVIECDKECKYLKIMIFVGGQHIKTERIAGGNGSIASAVMSDAINGQLEQAVVTSKTDNTKKSHVWHSEQDGVVLIPVES